MLFAVIGLNRIEYPNFTSVGRSECGQDSDCFGNVLGFGIITKSLFSESVSLSAASLISGVSTTIINLSKTDVSIAQTVRVEER